MQKSSTKSQYTMRIDKKPVLLIATDCFMPRIDGIARFLEMLIPHLCDFRVILVAPDFKGKFIKKGDYSIYRIPLRKIKIGDFPVPKKPGKDILGLVDDADLIFAQTIGPVSSAIINQARKRHKKIVSFVHSLDWVLVEKSLSNYALVRSIASFIAFRYARRIYSKCDALIVPSANIGEIFSARGIKNPKYIVHLGIDPDYFSPSDKLKAKEAIGLKPDGFVVGYVGRIAREKDLSTLKRAFNKLEGDNTLLIVGEGVKSIENIFKGPKIMSVGRVDDVAKYLNAMDVFVMPSLTETTCLAVLEAMSCKLPVISTKVGYIKEYIKNKENGLLFPKESDIFLAIKLNYLRESPLVRQELGEKARETVLNAYNYTYTVNGIIKVLKLHLNQ
jgi:glycosyltransferase involved in cell wall biosynthesis